MQFFENLTSVKVKTGLKIKNEELNSIFKLNWSRQILNKYGEYLCVMDDTVVVDLWKRCLQEFDGYLTFEARGQNRKEDMVVTFDSKEVGDLGITFDSKKMLVSANLVF